MTGGGLPRGQTRMSVLGGRRERRNAGAGGVVMFCPRCRHPVYASRARRQCPYCGMACEAMPVDEKNGVHSAAAKGMEPHRGGYRIV